MYCCYLLSTITCNAIIILCKNEYESIIIQNCKFIICSSKFKNICDESSQLNIAIVTVLFLFIVGSKTHIAITFDDCEGVFQLLFSQTWTDLDETPDISEGWQCGIAQKNWGESCPQPSAKWHQNVLCFFVHDQYSASFLATWISAILETGMNQCPGAYTDDKF